MRWHYLLLHVVLRVHHLPIVHHGHLGVRLELGSHHLISDAWRNNNITIVLIKWPVNLLLVTIIIFLLILALAWGENGAAWLSLRKNFLDRLHIALLRLGHVGVLVWRRALAPISALLTLKHHLIYACPSLTRQNLIWLLRCAKMARVLTNHLVQIDHAFAVILYLLLHVHSILVGRNAPVLHRRNLSCLDQLCMRCTRGNLIHTYLVLLVPHLLPILWVLLRPILVA